MEVILDTNFIISCLRRKIDFIGRLKEEGFKVLIPKEVMEELKDLKLEPGSHENRAHIDMALRMLTENKDVKKMRLGNKKVDVGLIDMGKKGAYIATLDNAIKRSVPNRVIILDSKNDIEIQRS